MTADDFRFYKRREEQALRMAEDACSPTVAAIHRDMARRYGEMANAERVPVQRLGATVSARQD